MVNEKPDYDSERTIDIMLSLRGDGEKPGIERIKEITSELRNNPVEISLDDLADKIENGHSFIASHTEGGVLAKNWKSQSLFCLDFDNGLTVAEFMDRCEACGIQPSIVYPTFSHTEEHPKFRAIFLSKDVIKNEEQRNEIQAYLMDDLFPEADRKCRNSNRIYFGTNKKAIHVDFDAEVDFTAFVKEDKLIGKPVPNTNITLLQSILRPDAEKLIIKHWVEPNRNSMAMALTGGLIRKWNKESIESLIRKICQFANDDELENRLAAMNATIEKYNKKKPVTGFNTLREYMGDNDFNLFMAHMDHRKKPGIPDDIKEKYAPNMLGRQFVEEHNVRYIHDVEKWAVFNGKVWEFNEHAVKKMAQKWLDNKLRTIKEIKSQDDANLEALDFEHNSIVKLSVGRGIRDLLEGGELSDKNTIKSTDFNTKPELLTFLNGTLELADLRKGKITLREHRADDYFTHIIPHEYNQDKTDFKLLKKFLFEILPDEETYRWLLQTLSRIFVEKIPDLGFFFYGAGRNGKSTLTDFIMHVMGDDLATVGEAGVFSSNRYARNTNSLARYVGKRLVVIRELEKKVNISGKFYKDLTSKGRIEVKKLYTDVFLTENTWNTIIETNSKPTVDDTDDGFWRRVWLVPFNKKIKTPDEKLLDKLKLHSEDFINMMVAMYWKYLNGEIHPVPKVVVEATTEYRSDENLVEQFCKLYLVEQKGYRQPIKPLWDRFKTFVDKDRKITRSGFYEDLGREYTIMKSTENQTKIIIDYRFNPDGNPIEDNDNPFDIKLPEGYKVAPDEMLNWINNV